MVETIAICDGFCLWNSSGSGIRCQAYSNIKGITMAVLEPERANQLVKEAGKAFALSAGVMGGIITTENDVIRIFGITLLNWLLIISAIYSLIQIFFFQAMFHSRSSHNLGQQHRDQARRKTFMFEYSFRGLTFGFDTSAETEAEARERLKAMQAAQIVFIGYQDDRIDFFNRLRRWDIDEAKDFMVKNSKLRSNPAKLS